jgi:hypothetical protein
LPIAAATRVQIALAFLARWPTIVALHCGKLRVAHFQLVNFCAIGLIGQTIQTRIGQLPPAILIHFGSIRHAVPGAAMAKWPFSANHAHRHALIGEAGRRCSCFITLPPKTRVPASITAP